MDFRTKEQTRMLRYGQRDSAMTPKSKKSLTQDLRHTIDTDIDAAVTEIYALQGMQEADAEEFMAPRIVNILQALVEKKHETSRKIYNSRAREDEDRRRIV